jgi:hypothetical protein
MKSPIILIVVVVMVLMSLKAYRTPDPTTAVPVHQVALHSIAIYSSENLRIEPPSEKYRYQALQLYPIYASTFFLTHHQHLGPYLSLQEAMEQKKIVIIELTEERTQPADTTIMAEDDGGSAEVNRLFVENISSDTIIILGGEIVRGGKQDRMIARDFMIPPHSGKLDIAVYCVEHGRWAPTDETVFFSIAEDVAPSKVRKAAADIAPQEKVWEEVKNLNEDLEVHAPTEALASALDDVDMKKSTEPYKENLGSIDWPANVVGVIAVMGTEIVGLDIFAQHELFTKYYPSLLSSYSSDAHEDRDDARVPHVEVQSFLTALISDEASLDKRMNEQGTQLKHNGYRIHVADYSE